MSQPQFMVVDASLAEQVAALTEKVDRLLEKARQPAKEPEGQPFGFMRIDQILEIIPIGKSTWQLWVQEGKAPQGIFLSERVKVWRVEDIRAFVERLGEEAV